jgi:hypothetical protein
MVRKRSGAAGNTTQLPDDSREGVAGADDGPPGDLPGDLADCLLDSCLDPVLDDAAERGRRKAARKRHASASDEAREVETALLAVTVCDPACGAGQFLVKAARRIANRVAAARERTPDPSAGAVREALRDVVGTCVYGVDVRAEAVELAKASLRRECGVQAESGAPASDLETVLDGRIRQGNSLIGAIPRLVEGGIPDAAFKPADGDDPKVARALLRANVRPVPGQVTLFSDHARDTPLSQRLVADAWCAAFTWAKTPDAPPAVVNRALLDLRERGPAGVLPATLAEIGRLRGEHGFFHWHLEFPDVFRAGGFSCVLARPPRDTVDRREDRATFAFASRSGAYPECAQGLAEPGVTALSADQLFTERLATLVAPTGRAGCAVPTSIATAPGGRHLFGGLMRRGEVVSLYGFDDRLCLLTLAGEESGRDAPRFAFGLPDTAALGAAEPDSPATDPDSPAADPDLPAADPDRSGRVFTLTPDDVSLINPNTGELPAFGNRRDAALIAGIYRQVPVLWNETRAGGNPWKMRLAPGLFRVTRDADLFRTRESLRDEGWLQAGGVFTRAGERMLPVCESSMAGLFDHRQAEPRYWAAERGPITAQRKGEDTELPGVAERLSELHWNWGWLCGWRKSCPPADERTAVAAFLPRMAVTDSFPLMLPRVVPPFAAALIAAQSSLVFDFVARRKLGASSRNTAGGGATSLRPAVWKQLPVPAPATMEPHLPFIVPRVLELVYTAGDMRSLAQDLDDEGEPFTWDEDRRAGLRAELDAFFFRLYGIDDRDDVEYILEAFQAETAGHEDGGGLKRNEIRDYGEYRTRRLVLSAYDRMAEADAADRPYETRLLRPPGHGARQPPPESAA